ncbi:uncharacterized protein LOC113298000 [Papaver somniferum]|uniref:uncharacterized protein LOC113298000 n=1 Tax=Papaver somniferum TaxID=3469 RepID=UPI000E7060B4|nr:uncharacterized protein LOC113298000 [Papaver somniferum]
MDSRNSKALLPDFPSFFLFKPNKVLWEILGDSGFLSPHGPCTIHFLTVSKRTGFVSSLGNSAETNLSTCSTMAWCLAPRLIHFGASLVEPIGAFPVNLCWFCCASLIEFSLIESSIICQEKTRRKQFRVEEEFVVAFYQ